jgi:hypothetical protein
LNSGRSRYSILRNQTKERSNRPKENEISYFRSLKTED